MYKLDIKKARNVEGSRGKYWINSYNRDKLNSEGVFEGEVAEFCANNHHQKTINPNIDARLFRYFIKGISHVNIDKLSNEHNVDLTTALMTWLFEYIENEIDSNNVGRISLNTEYVKSLGSMEYKSFPNDVDFSVATYSVFDPYHSGLSGKVFKSIKWILSISKYEEELQKLAYMYTAAAHDKVDLLDKGDYINLDYNNIQGYSNLSDNAKNVFNKVYKKHNSCLGIKEDYIPVKVKEHKKYLEVHFKNGEWLHYLPNGTWY